MLNLFAMIEVEVQSYNILAMFPLQLKSHYIIFDSILTELANRGHNITAISSFPKTKPVNNFKDVDVSGCFKYHSDLFNIDVAHTFQIPWIQIPIFMYHIYEFEQIFTCQAMTEFMKTVSEGSFDLLISEIFNGDVMLAYTKKFKAPFMSFCASPIYPWVADRTGNPYNPSYSSYTHTNVPVIANPSFYERLYNTVVYIYASLYYYSYSYINGDGMVRRHFSSAMPPLTEIAKNTSLVLTFSHFSLNRPMPLVPNIVEISGVQIQDPKPLPKVKF